MLLQHPVDCDEIIAIMEEVADEAGVSIAALRGDSRKSRYVWPRHVAMWRAHREGFALARICRAFQRDHSSVMSGVRRVEQRLAEMGAEEAPSSDAEPPAAVVSPAEDDDQAQPPAQ